MKKPEILILPFKRLPGAFTVGNRLFSASSGINPKVKGFQGHFREDKPTASAHGYVFKKNGALWLCIDHIDKFNPHYHPVKHFVFDVCG